MGVDIGEGQCGGLGRVSAKKRKSPNFKSTKDWISGRGILQNAEWDCFQMVGK